MRWFLHLALKSYIVSGVLIVHWPDGGIGEYHGGERGPRRELRLRTTASVRRIALNPTLAFGECYMDGDVEPVGCDIYDLLDFFAQNEVRGGGMAVMRLHAVLRRTIRYRLQINPPDQSKRNVAHHYDWHEKIYSLFLDRDRQYSCAYFPTGSETLDEAQILKKRHLAAKLNIIRPGLRVLDIGCGWGGLALTLARDYGAQVVAITLSAEQLQTAQRRADTEGLSDRIEFRLMDYRALTGVFDRIVSVGMFEHVGVAQYNAFFNKLSDCLAPNGLALLHTIGRGGSPGVTNSWIAKYIFPGGYVPALSEVAGAVEQSGLMTCDVEILRGHYALTLHHWRQRFAANRDLIGSMTDERFCRMFEFYLAASEITFRRRRQVVYQFLLSHEQSAMPLTRDYIGEAERLWPIPLTV